MLARLAPRAGALPAAHALAPFSTAPSFLSHKPRVVILGSGWGGFALAKTLDHTKFDVTLVRYGAAPSSGCIAFARH